MIVMMYVLGGEDGHTPIAIDPDAPSGTWANQFDTDNRRVALTQDGEISVSTVFLGVDHNYCAGGPPLLFETMVFGGVLDGEQEGCTTWEQAEEQHREMVRRVTEQEQMEREGTK